jgi:hypothetical protein
MDIQEFLQQSVGKWVSQRTSHYLTQNQTENAKSDMFLEALPAHDAAVAQLCQQQGADPVQAAGGIKMTWSSTVDRLPKPQTGSSIWVLVPDADQPNQGNLLSQIGSQTLVGRYLLGDDEVLTLTTDTGQLHAEERIWFAGPNFRLRTNVIRQGESYSVASFCSEIRLSGAPTAQSAATESSMN